MQLLKSPNDIETTLMRTAFTEKYELALTYQRLTRQPMKWPKVNKILSDGLPT